MSSRRSRIQRKAARVEKTEVDREFGAERAKLQTTLTAALAAANETHRQGVKKLGDERAAARAEAYEKFDTDRGKLLKRLAAKEEATA